MTSPANQADSRIVVGVDGSDCSKVALRFAMTQARLVGATVEAVAAWQEPALNGFGYGWVAPPSGDSLAMLTQQTLDQTVDEVSASIENPVEVKTRVEQGHPALVLPEVAIGAMMLVVGSRGHGAFAGMVLGSVSQHCVQHLSCPVVVVPLVEVPAAVVH
jgi:nucleotide-binding universal stress UspA family protein